MYAFLRRYLQPRPAVVVLVVWYALLVFLVLLFSDAPTPEFRYGDV